LIPANRFGRLLQSIQRIVLVTLNRRETLIRARRGDRDRLAQDVPVIVSGVGGVVSVIELQQVRCIL
jgi:hypothetical protein